MLAKKSPKRLDHVILASILLNLNKFDVLLLRFLVLDGDSLKTLWITSNLHMFRKQRLMRLSLHLPANIYLFKVSNRNGRKSCEICLKLTIKTPERRELHRSSFVVFQNFF